MHKEKPQDIFGFETWHVFLQLSLYLKNFQETCQVFSECILKISKEEIFT